MKALMWIVVILNDAKDLWERLVSWLRAYAVVIMDLTERFGEWMIERGATYLFYGALSLGSACVFVQLGIHKGRALEREEIAADFDTLKSRLAWAEAEQDRLDYKFGVMFRMIECESSGRHEGVWGDAGQSYGLLQVQKKTFDELAKKAGLKGANWKNALHQLRVLSWALDNGYGYKWTCYEEVSV